MRSASFQTIIPTTVSMLRSLPRLIACVALFVAALPESGLAQTAAPSDQEAEGLPPEERILNEAFPGTFAPLKEARPWFWSVDMNGDGNEDLIMLVKSKVKLVDAWAKLPISNPPYEWASRGEIQENPMFEPHYSIREGETYVIVVHGGLRGWKELSLGQSYILQDVAEETPELTSFGPEDEKTNGLKIRYEGKPGLLYFAGDRYVVALKDE